MTAHDALPIGTVIGDFEIRKVLGKGGFGIVYEAYEPPLDRRVALKEYFLQGFSRREGLDVFPRDEESVAMFESGMARFIREARLLSMLNERTRTDGSLVAVYRVFQAHRTAFMAMKLYEGQTLRRVVQADPAIVTEPWLTSLLRRMLDALQALHSLPGENLVHRDVSPDNIVIQPDGTPVLLDFGATRNVTDKMTSLIYKPGYSPIEQYTDAIAQGPWTDLYALCGTAYFAIGGKSPVPAVDRYAGAAFESAVQRGVGRYSQAFLEVIDHGMAVMPEQRYRSAEDMRAALDRVATTALAPTRSAVMAAAATAPPLAAAATHGAVPTDDASAPTVAVAPPAAGNAAARPPAAASVPASAAPVAAPNPLLDDEQTRRGGPTAFLESTPVPFGGRRQSRPVGADRAGGGTAPAPAGGRRTAIWAVGGLALVGAAGIGLWLTQRSPAPMPTPQEDGLVQVAPASAPGSTPVDATASAPASPASVAGSTPTPVVTPGASAPLPTIAAAPAPQRTLLACDAASATWACAVDGLARLSGSTDGVSLRITPDHLRVGQPIVLDVVPAENGTLHLLTVDDTPKARLSILYPAAGASARVTGGRAVKLPDMVAQPPLGRTWVIAVHSEVPIKPDAALVRGIGLPDLVRAFAEGRAARLLGVSDCTDNGTQCPKTLSIRAAEFIIE
jgi:non-specific serine/threonine protein kinase